MGKKYLIDETTLTNIASAIRTKTNSTGDIPVTNFANEILNIQDGEDLSTEIATQEEKIAEQDAIIANLMTALEGKAAGGGSGKTTKTIYLDWSGDTEQACWVQYISNNEKVIVNPWDGVEIIEAEYGIVYYGTAHMSYTSDNFIHFGDGTSIATQDGETVYFVSSDIQ